MTTEIALTLTILLITVILLITERLRVDLIALLVLGSLVLTNLVTPTDALSGFSNPAVITVWAVFILGGAISRTGVANAVGRQVLRLSGKGEARLLVVIMLTAAIMSAFMNNVGVAALLLPVVIHIARQTQIPPSKLLMPLAFGALLGGMTTLIGTPPNILASDSLRDFGMEPFQFFDFAPVGVIIMIVGIVFMVLIGRHLLPERDVTKDMRETGTVSLRQAFEIQERLSIISIPKDSALAGKTLVESRIGSAIGLNVIGIVRNNQTNLSPGTETILHGGDRLLVAGSLELLDELREQRLQSIVDGRLSIQSLKSKEIGIAEVEISPQSSFPGNTLQQVDFRSKFGVNVLAIWREGSPMRKNLSDIPLLAGDILLVQASDQQVDDMRNSTDLVVSESASIDVYRLIELLFTVSVPGDSTLVGKTLVESRLGDAYDLTILGIFRNGEQYLMPEPTENLHAGDILLVEGKKEELVIMRALQKVEVEYDDIPGVLDLESEQVGLVDAVLSPQTKLVGKTLRQIHFREKFGLNVLAIWRDGQAYRSNLRDMAMKFGDAMLLHGRWEKLKVLAREPDFILFAEEIQEAPRRNKALLAALIMVGVVVVVILGWLPIAIAAVIGGTLMVLSGSLNMEEAYHYIDWRAVFLIAGMLPLGIAMEKSGAASFLAGSVANLVGEFGPLAVVAGIFLMTILASQFMPNAVVTVLMAPIALNIAVNMNISPPALIMAVAIAASAAFLSPVGHPANVLIMGPGGYRFKDYLRVGVPLTIVILLVTLVVLPIVWPIIP